MMTPTPHIRRSTLALWVRVLAAASLLAFLVLLLGTVVSGGENLLTLPLAFCCQSLALAGFSYANWSTRAHGVPLAALYFSALAGSGVALLVLGDPSPSAAGILVVALNLLGAAIGGVVVRWYHGAE